MQLPHYCAVVAALLLQPALGQDDGQTLLGHVVEMLEDLYQKCVTDYGDEKGKETTHTEWCTEKLADAKSAVNATEQEMLDSGVKVEADTANINMHSINLQQLTASIANIEEDKKRAEVGKEKRKVQCAAASKTYTDAISALKAAIDKINERRPSPEFLQSNATQQNITALRAELAATAGNYTAFLGKEDLSTLQDPEFERVELSELYDMMEKVLGLVEEEAEKHSADCKESAEASDESISRLGKELAVTNDEHSGATTDLGGAFEDRNASQAAYANKKALLETYEGALSALQATCDTESFRLAEQLKIRQGEINALDKAIKLLQDEDLTATDVKHHSSFSSILQTSGGPSKRAALASLRAFLSNDGDGQRKTNEFLLERAHKLNSSLLMNLASSIRGSDPFDKVRTMIENLLARLKKEAASEQTEKEYCDENLPLKEDDHNEKLAQRDALQAEVNMLTAEVEQLNDEKDALKKKRETLESDMDTAADKRANETEDFRTNVKEAEQAKSVIVQALEILKGIFERHAALVQTDPVVDPVVEEQDPSGEAGEATTTPEWMAEAPSSSVAEYRGMEEDNDVVVLLEMVYQDFETLEADARATEAELAKDYEASMAASKRERAALLKEEQSKTMQWTDTKQKKVVAEENLERAETLLGDAAEVYTSLQQRCTDAGSTESDRVARREAEIKSLEEALGILEGAGAEEE